MYKRLSALVLAVLGVAVLSSDVAALARPELAALAAGMRVPGAVWLVGPMVLAVAGAVTLGWRRATVEGRSGLRDD